MKLTQPPRRIALVTDFGDGPYTGQLRLLLAALAENVPIIPLLSDLVPFRPDLAGFFLPSLMQRMPSATLYLCVVDPGVGGSRNVLAARVGNDWLIGPDNGLLVPCLRGCDSVQVFRVQWRPPALSDSFHGRDLFAPLAAQIVQGDLPDSSPAQIPTLVGSDWPFALAKVCYVDVYGNLISGVRADEVATDRVLRIGHHQVCFARTFCEVPVGTAFWYRNAFGLLEIAVNQGRADRVLKLAAGDDLPL
ncbi:MAG TPA: hypothetical protein DDY14_01595 [Chromatiaceae bacterium]|jgi:S-adenosylmethionine hydrolase|nr:MAG: hypothetical protein N838_02935 [Thiohalocapsa sp. PB-PSB1]QQO55575.1 MAG: SAM-dependent chlorinase/fluorinase [Thiohalocapsa sp. PB-PSB1]HBG94027.1 hypothetical protein [Chromatiaceae bacterium]HCS89386.1 hypothetical protein [Chromatiaceae bacterium]